MLTYIAQLEEVPDSVVEAESRALRRAAVGPGNWVSPEDLWYLQLSYGQCYSFRSIRGMAWAAKVRVTTWEPLSLRNRSLEQRARDLEGLLRTTDWIDRLAVWQDWYSRSHLRALSSARRSFETRCEAVHDVLRSLARGQKEPWPARTLLSMKRSFQRAVYQRILVAQRPSSEMRMRHKLERWGFADIPRRLVRRVLSRLEQLRNLVAPRVTAAYFSALWNRWTTARRFQQRHESHNICVLGCGGLAEDSIEH